MAAVSQPMWPLIHGVSELKRAGEPGQLPEPAEGGTSVLGTGKRGYLLTCSWVTEGKNEVSRAIGAESRGVLPPGVT